MDTKFTEIYIHSDWKVMKNGTLSQSCYFCSFVLLLALICMCAYYSVPMFEFMLQHVYYVSGNVCLFLCSHIVVILIDLLVD